MTRAIEAAAWLVFLVIVGAVLAAAWLVWRLVESTVAAVPPVAFQIAGGAGLFAFCLVTVGGALALVRWMAGRSRQIHARDGLYPVIDAGRGRFANPNEPGAQSLAVLAAGRRPTAALAGRVIDAQYRTTPEPAALPEPEPALSFPQQAAIYTAPMPRDLALPVGIDGTGRPVALPLRNLGNVLVAGLPGSGKSELLASMLAGLLRQDSTGRRVQIATVDTKLVTFGNLPSLAALYAPPALEIEDAHALVWGLVEEVRRRFQLLQAAGVRSIEEYQSKTGEALPYLVTVIDELADMTADHDRKRAAAFSGAAMEIGRKGRAAGVALVMATQRPSVDVIPSSLRNLAGAAVCFRVNRNHDSMAVLGEPGAELLPATPGRCLVKRSDTRPAQAYMAGLEGGQFDRFLLDLPHVDGIEAPAWPVRDTGIPTESVTDGRNTGSTNGIPVFSTAQTGDYTPEQAAHIRALYAELGKLKAVQRALYDGQEGGHWFYRIREVIEGR